MPYVSNKSVLKNVYCDVLIGIGEHTRYSRLSATLKERVDQCVQSHIDAFDNRTKDPNEHTEFVQKSQVFCKEQM